MKSDSRLSKSTKVKKSPLACWIDNAKTTPSLTNQKNVGIEQTDFIPFFLSLFLFFMFLSFIPPLSLISGTQSLDVHKHTLANVGWWIRKHKTANRTFYCWRSEVKGINWVTLSLQPYLSWSFLYFVFCVLWPPFNLLLVLSLNNTQSGKHHLHKMVRIIVIINLGKFSSSFSIRIFVKNTVQRLKIIT